MGEGSQGVASHDPALIIRFGDDDLPHHFTLATLGISDCMRREEVRDTELVTFQSPHRQPVHSLDFPMSAKQRL